MINCEEREPADGDDLWTIAYVRRDGAFPVLWREFHDVDHPDECVEDRRDPNCTITGEFLGGGPGFVTVPQENAEYILRSMIKVAAESGFILHAMKLKDAVKSYQEYLQGRKLD